MESENTIEATPIEAPAEPPKRRGRGRPAGSRSGREALDQIREQKRIRSLELVAQGLPTKDVAKLTGLTPRVINDAIKTFAPVLAKVGSVEAFREVRADLFAASQAVALKSALSPSKLAKSSFAATVKGLETLHKMERLERGQSTENVSHKVFARLELSDGMPDE